MTVPTMILLAVVFLAVVYCIALGVKRKRQAKRAKYLEDKERYLSIKRYRREVIKRENSKLKQELILLGIIDEYGNPIEEMT